MIKELSPGKERGPKEDPRLWLRNGSWLPRPSGSFPLYHPNAEGNICDYHSSSFTRLVPAAARFEQAQDDGSLTRPQQFNWQDSLKEANMLDFNNRESIAPVQLLLALIWLRSHCPP